MIRARPIMVTINFLNILNSSFLASRLPIWMRVGLASLLVAKTKSLFRLFHGLWLRHFVQGLRPDGVKHGPLLRMAAKNCFGVV